MVHALSESWRILKKDGRLIDMRPYKSDWFVDIVRKGESFHAGQFLGKKEGLMDDEMSEKAISKVIQRGLFKEESKEFFEYAYYWDSVDQMHEYASTTWRNLIGMPKNVLIKAHQLEKELGGNSVLRIRRKILIASYRKLFIKDDGSKKGNFQI